MFKAVKGAKQDEGKKVGKKSGEGSRERQKSDRKRQKRESERILMKECGSRNYRR